MRDCYIYYQPAENPDVERSYFCANTVWCITQNTPVGIAGRNKVSWIRKPKVSLRIIHDVYFVHEDRSWRAGTKGTSRKKLISLAATHTSVSGLTTRWFTGAAFRQMPCAFESGTFHVRILFKRSMFAFLHVS